MSLELVVYLNNGGYEMEPEEIMLKEYDTLREEILTAMQGRNSMLSYGLAAIGAILTVALALMGENRALSGLVIGLICPSICLFVLFTWLGEYQRMQRAGRFLVDVEGRINQACGRELLTWETSLRSQRRHMKYPYNTTVLLLTLVSGVTCAIGIVLIDLPTPGWLASAIIGLVLHVAMYLYAVSAMSKLRL